MEGCLSLTHSVGISGLGTWCFRLVCGRRCCTLFQILWKSQACVQSVAFLLSLFNYVAYFLLWQVLAISLLVLYAIGRRARYGHLVVPHNPPLLLLSFFFPPSPSIHSPPFPHPPFHSVLTYLLKSPCFLSCRDHPYTALTLISPIGYTHVVPPFLRPYPPRTPPQHNPSSNVSHDTPPLLIFIPKLYALGNTQFSTCLNALSDD